jgi:hypothetical protein
VQEGRLEYRLGFRSRILERESAAAGIPLAPSFGYFWDGYRFFLPRLRYAYKNFKRGAPDEFPRPPQREGGRHAQEDAWQWFAGATDGLAQRWDGAARRALGPLAEVIEALPGRDRTTVVLLQGPVSERALRDVYGEELFARYRRDIEAYAAQYGYEYWSLADDAELTQADFYDWGHLNSAGARERFTAVLADRLASVLDEP